MKIRYGFVSNSSTTSFCIYGIAVNDDLDASLSLKARRLIPKILERYSNPNCLLGELEYIGVSPYQMEDNETKKQFEERVKKTIVEFLTENDIEFDENGFCWYLDGWYDGG